MIVFKIFYINYDSFLEKGLSLPIGKLKLSITLEK